MVQKELLRSYSNSTLTLGTCVSDETLRRLCATGNFIFSYCNCSSIFLFCMMLCISEQVVTNFAFLHSLSQKYKLFHVSYLQMLVINYEVPD